VLAAEALRVANSPLVALRTQVRTLQHAVHVLGLDGARDLALTAIVGAMRKTRAPWGPLIHRHVLLTAGISRLLARRTPYLDASEAFVVGLLHDLGLQLLLALDGETTARLLHTCYHNPTLLDRAERMHFGFTHAELSAWCIRAWGLPPSMSLVVSAHHDPVPMGRADLPRQVLSAADMLADQLLSGADAQVLARHFSDHPVCAEIGLRPVAVMDIMDKVVALAEEV
jgi:phosphoserine phosphatase RsbU/P